MDVTALYTWIPHSGGPKALQYFLNKHSTLHPATDTLYRRAELVLTKNAFSFCDEIFSRDEWCSDGSQLIMSIFIGHFEQKLLQQYSKPAVPEMYKVSSMMVLAQHQWATATFWTSSALCITFILRWNSHMKFYCLTVVSVSFCSLTRGITPKICRLCVCVLIKNFWNK